jgi:Fe2+ or Zn2+ uptake regulation protein
MIKERSVIDGNKIEEVHLYFKGICKNCLAKERKNQE